ncbi:Ig-like domain-containing protein [Paludibacterium sp. B53371]|uniref:Ig-like domain-containing protein n=1 Tax=Paludibacterium sp. B53371 TaxID=2806263 RepID=UPI001C056A07|nr:Ig-like domain-containing protein [Paludibacterium sp. B53371]
MATPALSGRIAHLKGVVKVIDAQGHEHILKVGEVIRPGEQLLFDKGASLTLSQDSGGTVVLSGEQDQPSAPASDQQNAAQTDGNGGNANTDVQQVLNNLASGQDPTAQLDPASAGLQADTSTSSNLGHTFITLSSTDISSTTTVSSLRSSNSIASLDNFGRISNNQPQLLAQQSSTNGAPPASVSIAGITLTNQVEPTLRGTGQPGLTVLVSTSLGTVLGSAVVASNGTWSLTPTVPLGQGSTTLIASSTNTAGQTAVASASVTVDSIPPNTPTVSIIGHNGEIGAADETNGRVQVQVSLDNSVHAGDVIRLSNGSSTLSHTVTAAELSSGHASLNVTAPGNGQTMSVSATITDAAGNTSAAGSASALVDTVAPNTPQVSILGHNGEIGAADETNGQVQVQVTLDNSVKAGDSIQLRTGSGATIAYTVLAADLAAGHVTLNVTAPANGETLVVSATITDAAGNTSAAGSASALVDTVAPDAPQVSILGHNGEIGAANETNGQVQVQVSLNRSVQVGDSILLTTSTGATVAYTVQAADLTAGHATLNVTAPASGQTLVVSATVTDGAGNTSAAGTASALVDTVAPDTPQVFIQGHNGEIGSANEINGQVQVRVVLDSSVQAGDTLTLSTGNGQPIVYTVQASDLSAGQVLLNVSAPANGQTLTVTATLTDAAGNTSSAGSASALVDTEAPNAPNVTIVDHNGVISTPDEHNGQVQVRVFLDSSARVGDILTLQSSNGQSYAHTISTADIQNGQASFSLNAPANGQTLTVTATVTDAAGNSSAAGSASAVVDTTGPNTPTVTIVDHNGVISTPDERNGQVTVQVALDGSVKAGDTISLTANGVTQTHVVSSADLNAGHASFSVAAPADGQSLNASATITDALGNSSAAGSASAVVDTTGPNTPTVTIVDHNGVISTPDERNGQVQVQVNLDSSVKAGDTISLTANGVTQTHVVSSADLNAGHASFSVAAPADGQSLNASATITDALGNSSAAGSASAVVDTTGPNTPTVTIVDHNGVISTPDEPNGQVQVQVNLDSSVKAGDTISLTANGVTLSHVVSSADLNAGHASFSVAAPADGQSLNASATITDALGNSSAAGSASAVVDTTGPNTPTVTIVDHNGVISTPDERNGQVTVQVALDGSVKAGDTISLTANGVTLSHVVSSADLNAGHASFSVAAPADGQSLNASATITDALGNSSAAGSASAVVDTTGPNTPTVTIVDHNGVISTPDERNGQVQVQVNLDSSVKAGDSLTMQTSSGDVFVHVVTAEEIHAGNVTLTVTAPLNGQTLDVSAVLTDALGNQSQAGSDSAVVNTTAPNPPEVSILDHNGEIGLGNINQGQVSVLVSLDESVKAGDTVLLSTGNGLPVSYVLQAADISAGQVTLHVSAPANGETLQVSATITDTLGNTSDAGTDSALVDTQAPNAPQISVAGHNGEIGIADVHNGKVSVQVALDGSVQAGDTLTLTGSPGINISYTVQPADLVNGHVNFNLTVPANGATLSLNATLTDAAGNTSPAGTVSALVDTQAPDTPNVVILGHNGEIGIADEHQGQVSVQIGLDSAVKAGDIIHLSTGAGAQINYTVQAGDLQAGHVVLNVTAPANGQTLQVAASITDLAGNTSPVGTASALVDTVAPLAPTITIMDHNGTIAGSDESNGLVSVRIGLDHGVQVGDTLTLLSSNGLPLSHIITASEVQNGQVQLNLAAPANGATLTLSATLTDQAGNVSAAGSASAVVDTQAPNTPAVTIVDHNGVIGSADEQNGMVSVNVALDGSVKVGDTITLSSNTGSQISHVVSASDLSAGQVGFSVGAPANGATLNVSASIADPYGNTSGTGNSSAVVHLDPIGSPSISLLPNGLSGQFFNVADSHISSPLAGQTALSTVLADLQGRSPSASFIAQALNFGEQGGVWHGTTNFSNSLGSSLNNLNAFLGNSASNLQLNGSFNSTQQSIVTLGGAFSAAAGTYTLNVNADDGYQIIVDGHVVAQFAGNQSPTVANTAITLGHTAGDLHSIQIVYWDQGGQATLQVGLTPTGAPAGTVPTPISVAPPAGSMIAAVALDSSAQNALAHHGVLSVNEGHGQTVQLSFNSTGQLVDGNGLVYAYQNGTVYLPVPAPAAGETLTLSASVADGAGNLSPAASTSYQALSSPVVTLAEHHSMNNQISSSDLSNGQVQASVTLNAASLAANGSASVTVNSGGSLSTVTVHSDGSITSSNSAITASYSNGVLTLGLPQPANGAQVQVSAVQTDALGNHSAAGSDSGTLNLTAPATPVVSIAQHFDHQDGQIGNDNLVNGHIQATVQLDAASLAANGSASITINAGGTLSTLTVDSQGHLSSSNPAIGASYANGVVTLSLPEPANGAQVAINASQTNALGNVSAIGSDSGTLDLSAANAPSISLLPNGLSGQFFNVADSHISSPLAGQTALSTVLADLQGRSPSASFIAQALNFGEQGGVWHGTTNFSNSLGSSLNNLNAFLGNSASNLQLNGSFNSTQQSIVTLGGAFSAAAGTYTLNVNADDGYQIIVDGHVVAQFAGNQSPTVANTAITLGHTAGDLHSIQILYWDQGGQATLQVGLTPTGAPAGTVPTPISVAPPAGSMIAAVALDSSAQNALAHHGVLSVNEGHGQTVQLSFNSTGQLVDGNGLVYAYQNGTVYLPVPAPAAGETLTLSASVADGAGNLSPAASTSYQALSSPVVTLAEHHSMNNQISSSDLSNGQVQASVTLNAASLAANGSASVTVNSGGSLSTVTVHSDGSITSSNSAITASYSNGVLTLGLPQPANGAQVQVSAVQTDALGNHSAAGSDSGTLNLTAPATPVVSIAQHFDHQDGQIGNDNLVNGHIQATVQLDAASLAANGSASITINAGGTLSTLTVDSQGHLSSSNPAIGASYANGVVTLSLPEPANGAQVAINASQTNALGNVSAIGSDSGTLDLSAANAPSISLLPNGLSGQFFNVADSHISSPLAGQTALSTVLADLQGRSPSASFIAQALNFGEQGGVWHGTTNFSNSLGSSLNNLNAFLGNSASNLQLNGSFNSTQQSIVTLGGAFSAAAGTYTLNVNADDGYQIIVDGHVVAQFAGNQSPTVANTAITLGHTAGDLHSIQIVYWDQGGQATLQVGLTPTGAPAGTVPTPISVAPPAGSMIAAVALDSSAQNALAHHGVLSVNEGHGQTVQLSFNSAGQLVDGNGLVYAYQNGTVYLPVPAPAAGETLTLSASVADGAGNLSPAASTSYQAPASPVISIGSDVNHDGVLNAAETNHGTAPLHATVALDAGSLASGGHANITVNDNGVISNLLVNSNGSVSGIPAGMTASYGNGVLSLTVAEPGDGHSLSISAAQTDGNGFGSTTQRASVLEDITAPTLPGLQIATDPAAAGVITAGELNGHTTVNTSITLGSSAQSDLAAGGTLNITTTQDGISQSTVLHWNGNQLVDGNGQVYSYSNGVVVIPTTLSIDHGSLTLSASQTDAAGNTSSLAATSALVVDNPSISVVPSALPSTGLLWQTWAHDSVLSLDHNGGWGTDPYALRLAIDNTSTLPTSTGTLTDLAQANVAAGTATRVSGLIYLEAGHNYTFSGTEDDSFLLKVGGHTLTATWGDDQGELEGSSFTPQASGWYTIAAYHDNEAGPGHFQVQVSVDGAQAVELNTANFHLVSNLSDLSNAGLSVGNIVPWHGHSLEGFYTTAQSTAVSALPSVGLTQRFWADPWSPLENHNFGNSESAWQHLTSRSGDQPDDTRLVSGAGDTRATEGLGTVQLSGLIYLQAGHSYTFSNSGSDAWLVNVGGQNLSQGIFAAGAAGGTFHAQTDGWYTLAAYHASDLLSFNLQVSVDGGSALNLNTSNFHLVSSVADLTAAGLTTGNLNIADPGAMNGYYPGGHPSSFDITLDTLNQSLLTNGGSVHLTSSTGLDTTLHLSGNALVDAHGHAYSYQQGTIGFSLDSSSASTTVSVTLTDAHGISSDTVSTTLVNGDSTINAIAGVETFKFELPLDGPAGSPHVATINNFSMGSTAANTPESILDLRDLLQGESHAAAGASPVGNLANYLHFSTVNSGGIVSTVVHVSETGQFAHSSSPANDTAQIVLHNVDLTHLGTTLLSDQAILQNLLGNGRLQTD